MALIARAQVTICDLADPIVSGTAPANPVKDMLWMDTSQSPSVLRRWTGTEWEIVNETDASGGGINLAVGTQDWSDGAFTKKGDATVEDGILTVPYSVTDCTGSLIKVEGGSKYTVSFDLCGDPAYTGKVGKVTIYNEETELIETALIEDSLTTAWKRLAKTIAMPDDADFVYVCFGRYSASETAEGTGEVNYRNLKFEKGNVATPWCPAPQDVADETIKLANRLTVVESTAYKDSIVNSVFQSSTYMNDKAEVEYVKNQQSETKQTLNDYTLKFSNSIEQLGETQEEYNAWFTFSQDGTMKIGKSDSKFSMSLSNERLAFYNGQNELSYMSGNSIYNPNLVVTKTLTMGDPAENQPGILQAIMDGDGISWI